MKSKEAILDLLQRHRAELEEAFGVESLALFGSYARNEPRPDSDIDILVSFREPTRRAGR